MTDVTVYHLNNFVLILRKNYSSLIFISYSVDLFTIHIWNTYMFECGNG
ncbi:hypothetical protein C8N37_101666 [Sphingobacterium faecium]|nr:hypothetical protein C8N37_101666 [Sphingobacterium faecium]